jgi:molybdopterin-guanine dinucleotide biosynthesis protein A
MGGGNKALRLLAGETLLTHVLRRLRRNAAGSRSTPMASRAVRGNTACRSLPTGFAGFAGPLAGVLAGMEWAAGQGADRVISVSVDTPFLPDDLVHRLREARGRSGIALAASPDEGPAARSSDLRAVAGGAGGEVRAALESGLHRIGQFAASL